MGTVQVRKMLSASRRRSLPDVTGRLPRLARNKLKNLRCLVLGPAEWAVAYHFATAFAEALLKIDPARAIIGVQGFVEIRFLLLFRHSIENVDARLLQSGLVRHSFAFACLAGTALGLM